MQSIEARKGHGLKSLLSWKRCWHDMSGREIWSTMDGVSSGVGSDIRIEETEHR